MEINYKKSNNIFKNIWGSLFLKKYYHQGMVQFDEDRNIVACGCAVKWLDKLIIETTSYKKSIDEALKILNKKYPQYKNKVQLF